MEFTYSVPTKVIFGPGTLSQLAAVALPGRRALLCCTPGERSRCLERVQTLLRQNGVETTLYGAVQPNPTDEGVRTAAALGRAAGVDFVIGLGGGSSIDTAKAAALLLASGGDVWDYVSCNPQAKTAQKALPLVAISTTAGTGPEFDPCAVLSRELTYEKTDIYAPDCLFPTLTIVDPELHTSLPADLTAWQGMDVLFHAAEGYLSSWATPVSELYSLQALALVAEHLPAAVRNGDDLSAREGMALANFYAGMVESNSNCASPHALAHALGAYHPTIPHGAALCLVCRECFRRFAETDPDRMADMAQAVSYGHTADDFVVFLEDLLEEIGMDDIDYTPWGVTPANARAYAENSFSVTGMLHESDRHPMTVDECEEIFRKSLER